MKAKNGQILRGLQKSSFVKEEIIVDLRSVLLPLILAMSLKMVYEETIKSDLEPAVKEDLLSLFFARCGKPPKKKHS